MEISRCHRFLHINVQPWPANYTFNAEAGVYPPIGTIVNCHVLDLSSMQFVGHRVAQQTSYEISTTPASVPYRIPSITKHFIGKNISVSCFETL